MPTLKRITRKNYFLGIDDCVDYDQHPCEYTLLDGKYNAASTEEPRQISMPKGKFTSMKLNVFYNTLPTDTIITLRVNGAATALSITIPAGVTGLLTSTENVSIAEGDLCNLKLITDYSELGKESAFTWILEFQPA